MSELETAGELADTDRVVQVIMAHGKELVDETLARIRPFLDALDVAPGRVIGLAVNELTRVDVLLIAVDEDGTPIERCRQAFAGYNITDLLARFPDCEQSQRMVGADDSMLEAGGLKARVRPALLKGRMNTMKFYIRGIVEADEEQVAEFLDRLAWKVEDDGSVAEAIRSEMFSNLADVLAEPDIQVQPGDPEEASEVVGPVPTPTFLWLVADALEQHACVVIEADMVDGLGNLVGSDLGAAVRLRHLGNKLETLIFADDEGGDRAAVATN